MSKHSRRRRPYPSIQAWLDATGTNQQELARRVGITQGHLSNILRKSRRCSLYLALRLSRETNVPVELIADWPSHYGDVA